MNLQTVLDADFYSLIKRYSDSANESSVDSIKQIVNSIDAKEKIIPVLGMQGMGKSTLINALLGENILPNAADETTCVRLK